MDERGFTKGVWYLIFGVLWKHFRLQHEVATFNVLVDGLCLGGW
jgi:hypothetical protein